MKRILYPMVVVILSLTATVTSAEIGSTSESRSILLVQTIPWKGSQADYSQRCRETNLPGKHFYTEVNNAGQRGYCCTTTDKTQGWCCWDRGGGNFSCAAR